MCSVRRILQEKLQEKMIYDHISSVSAVLHENLLHLHVGSLYLNQ